VLGLRQVSVGDFVQAGDDLVSLVDLDPLKVDFRIPEIALAALRVGQEVAVSVDALPGETFIGSVYAIDPEVDVNGRAVILRASIDNRSGQLRPGLFARVSLVLERKSDALLVPEEAIVPQGEKQLVYTIVDGTATLVPVETGDRHAGRVEIVSGLAPGDRVVTAGQMKLRPGAKVVAEAAADSAAGNAAATGEEKAP
jgi:membrane fusion protein (multidrug efflux system)